MSTKSDGLKQLIRSRSMRRIGNVLLNSIEQWLNVSRPRSYPVLLDIVLTKACNLNCTFCVSSSVEGQRWLPYDLYERIARELFASARNVSFCSGGEPLLYPRIREVLRLAGSYRLNTFMVSNGMLLDDDTCRWMVADQSLTNYLVSFDGATKETLERIRRGANFHRIIANVANLARHRQAAGAQYPKLTLRYSVMKRNAEELPRICEIAKAMGVSTVDVSYVLFANDMPVRDSLFFHQDLAEKVFKETAANAKECGIQVHLPALPRDDGAPRRCGQPWRFLQIDTDGSLRFCYRAWIQTIGHFDDGFRSIWRGQRYRDLRKTLHSDSPCFPYCAFCSLRNGTNNEAAHNQSLHGDAYTFADESTSLSFNRRAEENRESFKSRDEAATP